MGLLARREHSRQELVQKMQVKGFAEELIFSNIDDFSDQDWQSDKRYAQMLLRSRISKCHGPIKINMELKQKGISAEIIEQCVTAEHNWSELALSALSKKYHSIPVVHKEKNKCYRFLQQRGFTNVQIIWAMKNLNRL